MNRDNKPWNKIRRQHPTQAAFLILIGAIIGDYIAIYFVKVSSNIRENVQHLAVFYVGRENLNKHIAQILKVFIYIALFCCKSFQRFLITFLLLVT